MNKFISIGVGVLIILLIMAAISGFGLSIPVFLQPAGNQTTTCKPTPAYLNQMNDIKVLTSSASVNPPSVQIQAVDFLVPVNQMYRSVRVLNASIFGGCSAPPGACNYYINNVQCGSFMTNYSNASVLDTSYTVSPACLSAFKGGINRLRADYGNPYGFVYVRTLSLEMEVTPATC